MHIQAPLVDKTYKSPINIFPRRKSQPLPPKVDHIIKTASQKMACCQIPRSLDRAACFQSHQELSVLYPASYNWSLSIYFHFFRNASFFLPWTSSSFTTPLISPWISPNRLKFSFYLFDYGSTHFSQIQVTFSVTFRWNYKVPSSLLISVCFLTTCVISPILKGKICFLKLSSFSLSIPFSSLPYVLEELGTLLLLLHYHHKITWPLSSVLQSYSLVMVSVRTKY